MRAASACKDPNGVLLEILEDDPRAVEQRPRVRDLPVATRFLTLSVPDLDEARNTWLDVLGLPEETEVVLHTPEHEALWGLDGASRESFVVRAQDIFLEVVQYLDPVGKPWPEGYMISHIGPLNVALGVRDEKEHDALVAHCAEHGLVPNSTKPTLLKKLWYAVYVNDPHGLQHRAAVPQAGGQEGEGQPVQPARARLRAEPGTGDPGVRERVHLRPAGAGLGGPHRPRAHVRVVAVLLRPRWSAARRTVARWAPCVASPAAPGGWR